MPEQSAGRLGTPGLVGNRGGADFSSALRVTSTELTLGERGDGDRHGTVVAHARDTTAALGLTLTIELTAEGLVRRRATVANLADTPCTGTFEVPLHAEEGDRGPFLLA
ncbi:hypothetical protein N6H00_39570 [Streptomyces sp. S465]|nr:hypothetical protein N6H00_39570 [Streptomyces sp. S465]